MTVEILKNNLLSIRERIEAAAVRSGRTAADVKLVAVTKYVDATTTKMLIDAGQAVLGESRPQVLWDKAESEVLSPTNPEWHLIGHLQRNKVNRSLKYCRLIHSVDSVRLLEAINASSEKIGEISDCLLEINISGEAAKHGLQPGEAESALVAASALSNIRIRGFMGMAGMGADENENRLQFASLRKLLERFVGFESQNIELSELSMGMSGDFELAIEEGSTLVRIGSSLFSGIL